MLKVIKKNIPVIIFILMFSIGMLIMLYPVISSHINSVSYNDIIKEYTNITNEYSNVENEQLISLADNYNKQLDSYSIMDVFSDPNREVSEEYINTLNIDGKGLMGYIYIPKIDVRIPIYHGTSSEVLEKGVGHLEGSSFPIGGINTHAILSAHRGLPSAKLFTDLDQLQIGDEFYIYILDKTLAYEVDQILVVEPSETEALQLQEGKDYITLVTCTPYAINTHRLLVRGTQVEYIEKIVQEAKVEKKTSNSDKILYIGIIIAVLLLIFAIIQIRKINKKEKLRKIQKARYYNMADEFEKKKINCKIKKAKKKQTKIEGNKLKRRKNEKY